MVKRIYALASVSALTGLLSAVAAAGCSSNDNADQSPTPVKPAPDQKDAPEASTPPPPDTEDDGGGKAQDQCMKKTAIDATKFPYASAKRQANACTQKEYDDLLAYFNEKAAKNGEEISVADWKKQVSENCAKCAFSETGGAEWAPILVKGDKLENVNRGGCIEIASGKRACGEAYQRTAECRLEACVDTCESAQEFAGCLQDVAAIFTGPCKGAYDTLQKECGENELPKYEAACKGQTYTFEGPLKVQCVTGNASSGT